MTDYSFQPFILPDSEANKKIDALSKARRNRRTQILTTHV